MRAFIEVENNSMERRVELFRDERNVEINLVGGKDQPAENANGSSGDPWMDLRETRTASFRRKDDQRKIVGGSTPSWLCCAAVSDIELKRETRANYISLSLIAKHNYTISQNDNPIKTTFFSLL